MKYPFLILVIFLISTSCSDEKSECSVVIDNENVTSEGIVGETNCDRFGFALAGNVECVSDKKSKSGKFSTELNKVHPYGMTYEIKNAIPGEHFKVTGWRHESCADLGIVASANNTDDLFIVQHNSNGIKSGEWDQMSFEFVVPESVSRQPIKIYLLKLNDSLPIYFDDLSIEYVTLSAKKTENVQSSFTDARDGQSYATVKIGNQLWMSENFRYHLNDSCFCYDAEPENCKRFGRLYSFQDACKVCPDGWALPSDDDWKTLEASLGMNSDDCDKYGNRGDYETFYLREFGSSGFNSKEAGAFDHHFFNLNKSAYYWTSTMVDDTMAYCREISHRTDIGRFKDQQHMKFSVRCIKNSK